MTSGLSAASIIASARRDRAEINAAEIRMLESAIAWVQLHEVTEDDVFATWGDSPIPIAGEGAPLISEFCIAEFATAIGTGAQAGRRYLAAALELSSRMPRTLAEVRRGRLRVWRAGLLAEATIDLSLEA